MRMVLKTFYHARKNGAKTGLKIGAKLVQKPIDPGCCFLVMFLVHPLITLIEISKPTATFNIRVPPIIWGHL